MAEAKVQMDVRDVGEGASFIDIRGEVSGAAENTLVDAYTRATTQGAGDIILNFAGLDYMNSSGIGLIVTILICANRQGQRLLACGLSEHYQHIFELTRLNEAILIFGTEEEALAGR